MPGSVSSNTSSTTNSDVRANTGGGSNDGSGFHAGQGQSAVIRDTRAEALAQARGAQQARNAEAYSGTRSNGSSLSGRGYTAPSGGVPSSGGAQQANNSDRQAALAAARSQQQRRNDEARRAADQREKQAERKAEAQKPASVSGYEVPTTQEEEQAQPQEEQQQQRQNVGDTDEIVGMDESSTPAPEPADNDANELKRRRVVVPMASVDNVEEASRPAPKARQRRAEPAQEVARSVMAQAVADAEAERKAASDARLDAMADRAVAEMIAERDARERPSEDRVERPDRSVINNVPIVPAEKVKGQPKHMLHGKHLAVSDSSGKGENFTSPEDMLDAAAQYRREVELESIATPDRRFRGETIPTENGRVPSYISDDDITWQDWQAIPDGIKNKPNKIVRYLQKQEANRRKQEYKKVKELSPDVVGNFDAQVQGSILGVTEPVEFENMVQKSLREARNMIYKRLINPTLLNVESRHVETRTIRIDGKPVMQSRIRYDDSVEKAIGDVRRLYNCSIRNVLQLIQLRAGLGVDSKGKIGNVDPDKFKLSDTQFIELCKDIIESQRINGHPLGMVQGKPFSSNVRDDSGKWVIVAGTRCFPLGYMPRELLRDLRASAMSPLSQMSERQIMVNMGNTWLNETYPALVANTTGNSMFQARAIENMMRAVMMMDGKNPEDLDIPELVERRTLMTNRTEDGTVIDPDIRMANRVKHETSERALQRWKHRTKKRSGSRFSDSGDIQSAAMKRKRNKIGDVFRMTSSFEMMSGAARLAIMISSIPENVISNRTQSLANILSAAWFRGKLGEQSKDYELTGELENMSQTPEFIEAREVSESLYRIGGLTAIDVFLGSNKYTLTRADLRKFMVESGINNEVSDNISDKIRNMFKIKPGEERGFISNAKAVLEGAVSGGGMFRASEAKQFMQLSLVEMARNATMNNGGEHYTNSQIAEWGKGMNGTEEIMRSLLMTDAGREAFMTQGITSLNRKSGVEHLVRKIMSANGVTEFLVRTVFDRFVEYDVTKWLSSVVPYSNTVCYLAANGVNNLGQLIEKHDDRIPLGGMPNFSDAMQRQYGYQVGSRMGFFQGLRKNLLYDTLTTGRNLIIAGIYFYVINMLGGAHEPPEENNRYVWSEWGIGSDEENLPLKWAWWMDDMSGMGLPLGMSLAIAESYGWSQEGREVATKTFINAVANFNNGNAIFEAIDFINNFDDEVDRVMGFNIDRFGPDEWGAAITEQLVWDFVGDMTPAILGELLPWSRDNIFRSGDQHTAAYMYDEKNYTREEAIEGNKVTQVDGLREYLRRKSAQTNLLYAMFLNWQNGPGYLYDEQPIATVADPYVKARYDQFFLDMDSLPIDDQEERLAALDANAEDIVTYITDHYDNAAQAVVDGLIIPYDARINCKLYCLRMIDQAKADYDAATSNGWLDDSVYKDVRDTKDAALDKYYGIINEYLMNEEIPWNLPRYAIQESDTETRYVDEQGNPSTYLNTLDRSNPITGAIRNLANGALGMLGLGSLGDEDAHAESYLYGNIPSMLPASSPRTEGKGFNYETIPYWAPVDENGNLLTDAEGNPITDLGAQYDNAENMVAGEGRFEGKNIQELMWGGQGNNKGISDERLAIERGGVPTTSLRPLRYMEETFPEILRDPSAEALAAYLGVSVDLQKDDDTSDSSSGGNGSRARNNYGSRGYGGRSYGRRSYGGSYGGGYVRTGGSYGGGVNYNPKIYSNPKNVNGDRASGLSVRQPYKATTTYLRPNFYTKGSREAYKRSDI